MHKRANSASLRYQTLFAPLPVSSEEMLYVDRVPVALPYAEDFPRLHYHDRYEVGVCEGGEGLFLSEGSFYSVSKGDLILIAPGRRHYSRSLYQNTPCICRFAYLRAETVANLLSCATSGNAEKMAMVANGEPRIPPILRASEHPQAAVLLSEIMEVCKRETSDDVTLAVLKLTVFLLEAVNWFGHRTFMDACPHRADDTVAMISEYLALHYNGSDSARELAAQCHLSESQLRRRFLAVYGIPPIAYRSFLRCQIAADLLGRTRLSISEIAERIGYTSASDFYRAFHKNYGMSPSAYRNATLF